VGAGGEAAERVGGGGVTPNLFPMLGVHPARGRHFLPEEAAVPGLEPTVILSDRLWRTRFGGDPAIVGRSILVNQRARTVVGVMPPGFRFPERDDLWLPYRPDGTPRDRRNITVIGLLRPGVTLAQLQSEMDTVAASAAARHPDTNRDWGLRALMYRDLAFDRAGRVAVFSLMGAVVLVLLIGCANLSNLLLAAGVARQREFAVRAAIGASRVRLVREMLAEGVLLSVAGGLLGALLGSLALDAMVAAWPEELAYWIHFDVDARVIAFLAAVIVATAVLFGLLPALRASRPDLIEQLKEGARSSGSRADRRLQGGLVVGQVALCLALLVGANLMIRTFLRLQSADPGFDERPLASLRLYLPGDAYDPLPAKTAFVRRAVEKLRSVPGVVSAAMTTSIPADDGGWPIRIVADGQPVAPGRESSALMIATVPSLFDTLGVRLVAGRPVRGRRDGAGGGARRDRQRKTGPALLAGRERAGAARGPRGRTGHDLAHHRGDCARGAVRGVRRRDGAVRAPRLRPLRPDGSADPRLPRARDRALVGAAAPDAGRAGPGRRASSGLRRCGPCATGARSPPGTRGSSERRSEPLRSSLSCSPVLVSTACSRTPSPAARARSACASPWARHRSTSCASWWARRPRSPG
jgi:predicted permease